MRRICAGLRSRGMQVVLDDFGDGNASVIHLRDLPVDVIKTSTLFMRRLDEDFSKDYIELIIQLSHSMKRTVCINGIETKEEYDYSLGSGADILQGFYLYTAQDAGILKKVIEKDQ